MNLTGNTILITGGGSGIGQGLAEAFHTLGNRVIVAGRRKEALDAVTAANPGMQSAVLDVRDAEQIQAFAAQAARQYPALNVLINNAGIMKRENLKDPPERLDDAEAVVTTNLLAPMRLTAALLPLLQRQPHAAVMMVSSGLAFVPMTMTPTYCATKAAIHSYTQSLRYQLRDTSVDVLELIPPYVATELLEPAHAKNPRAMPLADFLAETMEILRTQPESKEICVQRVYPLRFAAGQGQAKYEELFRNFNAALSGSS